MPTSITKGQLL